MVDQATLDVQWGIVASRTAWAPVNDRSVADLLWNGPLGLRQEVVDQIGNDAVWGTLINEHTVADILWHLRDSRPASARLVRAPISEDPGGAVYAVTTNSFRHIPGDGTFDAGVRAGLWGGWETLQEIPLAMLTLVAKFLGGRLYDPNDPDSDAPPLPVLPTPPTKIMVPVTVSVPATTVTIPLEVEVEK